MPSSLSPIHHQADFLKVMHQAWKREQNPAAKDASTQILVDSQMCAEGLRPICQGTGMPMSFKFLMVVRWEARLSLTEMVDTAVRKTYQHPDNTLCFSKVADPLGKRHDLETTHRILPGRTSA